MKINLKPLIYVIIKFLIIVLIDYITNFIFPCFSITVPAKRMDTANCY